MLPIQFRGGENLTLRLGDLVLRKGDGDQMLFRINAFLGGDVLLKGINLPVYTIAGEESLIKLKSRRRKQVSWEVISGS